MADILTEEIKTETSLKNQPMRVDVLIALWALTEASLGGVLHAFRIPLTGLFINSCSVIFMVLIALASEKRGIILRATLIVMIIKGMVSPHTPLTAYIAVGFQGLMGELLLRSKKYILFSSILLGVITLLQSAMQKIILLTIVYGNSLWETIDVFINFIIRQLPFLPRLENPLEFSFWLIVTYVGIHLIAGVSVGIVAPRIPGWIRNELKKQHNLIRLDEIENKPEIPTGKKKKSWLKKPSAYLIISIAGLIVLLSYLFPEISETQASRAGLMIVRSTCILILWYTLIGPYLLRVIKNFLKSKQYAHAQEVDKAFQFLVPLKYIINTTWKESARLSGIGRIKYFIKISLVNILSAEFSSDENY
jgi:hypothetical protein